MQYEDAQFIVIGVEPVQANPLRGPIHCWQRSGYRTREPIQRSLVLIVPSSLYN